MYTTYIDLYNSDMDMHSIQLTNVGMSGFGSSVICHVHGCTMFKDAPCVSDHGCEYIRCE